MKLAVFLVEDNPKIREHLATALGAVCSATVLATAASAPLAVAWLADHRGQWNLAMVDFVLEEGTGLEIVQWCNGREQGQRVVVLTNSVTEPIRNACLEAGADAFFDKATELDAFFDFCCGSA